VGPRVNEAKPLRALQEENMKLKRLMANGMLDNAALKASLVVRRWLIWEASSRGASGGRAVWLSLIHRAYAIAAGAAMMICCGSG
jgi:hypothetical protein